MRHYLYCNQTIASTDHLPALSLAADGTPNFWFRLEESHPQEETGPWLHDWFGPSGEKVLSYRKQGDGHLLRFPSLADFRISPSADQIACYPVPGTTPETIQHLFLDQVLPRCLAHQGMTMLHASAVSISGGVVTFIGSSGGGKSTLASYFHQTGYKALADDCVCVLNGEHIVDVIPSYDGLRLWPDTQQILFPDHQESASMAHYSSKVRIQTRVPESHSLDINHLERYPLLAVIVLTSSEATAESEIVDLEKLPPREVFIEMMKQSFLLDVTDPGQFSYLMGALGQMIPRIQSYKLRLPHDYKFLPQVRQMILDEISPDQTVSR